tara:strand:- start:1262 stop:1822 length:561 start_codon:yes stop_codon:yes gene_type:complete
MKRYNIFIHLLISCCLISFDSICQKIYGAERIILTKGIFNRVITIKELEDFSNKGIKKGFIKKVLKKEDELKLKNLLTKEHKAPLVLTSKLLSSNIGNIIINRISKIIYPLRIEDDYTKGLAIKSATIKALAEGNEKINVIKFLKAYPSKDVAINIDEVNKVIVKVESMSELVEFFTNSPLDKLKE